MTRRPDAIVVGAGIVGAACALELARAGLRVLVLERGFVGGQATAAGMGHLVVTDDSEAQFALTAYSRRLWTELAAELPGDCEDEACGTLWIAATDGEWHALGAKARFYRERGQAAEVLDAAALASAEPRLRAGLRGALRVPGDRSIYPPAAARFLVARAADRGAECRQAAEVGAIGPRHVVCGSERLEAGLIVNAAGAAAARLTPGLPIAPRRGHLVITERHPGFCRHQLVELGYLRSAHALDAPSVAFNVQPRTTGQLLIGSSREFAGFDPRPDPALCARMLRRAVEFLPGLARLQALRTWVGFRPATPDKLPLIGRHQPIEGLWLAAGHEGLGITAALGTARLLADLVVGRTPEIDPAPYAPIRLTRSGHAGLRAQVGGAPRDASARKPASAVGLLIKTGGSAAEASLPGEPGAARPAVGVGAAADRLFGPREASEPREDRQHPRGDSGRGVDSSALREASFIEAGGCDASSAHPPDPPTAPSDSGAAAADARFTILVDGRPVEAAPGTTVAAALWNAGIARFRTSVGGAPRGPICAMGVCFECRVTIDGAPHRRACLEPCRPGQRVATQ